MINNKINKMNTTIDIKLSDKQKKMVSLMRDGKELYTIFYPTGTSPNLINGKRITEPTFSKLSNLGIITFDKIVMSKTGLQRSYYKLTELGKTIKL